MANTAIYNNSGSGAQSLSQQADSIPDFNIWTKLAKASVKGVASYYSSMAQRRQLEAESNNYQYQAQTAQLNAALTQLSINTTYKMEELAQYDIRNATQGIYDTYRMGEYQAMEQGLQDAQIIHNQRAQTASSGVRMDSASKQEVDASNVQSAKVNQRIIQENTWNNVKQAQYQARQAEAELQNVKTQRADLQMQQANYTAQALIAQGNANASNIIAKSISPLMSATSSFVASMSQAYMNGSAGGGSGSASLGGYGAGWSSDGNTWDYTNFVSSLKKY